MRLLARVDLRDANLRGADSYVLRRYKASLLALDTEITEWEWPRSMEMTARRRSLTKGVVRTEFGNYAS